MGILFIGFCFFLICILFCCRYICTLMCVCVCVIVPNTEFNVYLDTWPMQTVVGKSFNVVDQDASNSFNGMKKSSVRQNSSAKKQVLWHGIKWLINWAETKEIFCCYCRGHCFHHPVKCTIVFSIEKYCVVVFSNGLQIKVIAQKWSIHFRWPQNAHRNLL